VGDLSCIYYTSNHEDPEFEHKIQVSILEVCDLPIISVSQKPIDFGENICVGDVGASGFNCFRQIQIACRAAKTRFVLSLEADCLYPPDYFEFVPARDDVCYRDSNLYVMPDRRTFFFHKIEGATHAQVIGREFYLETLDRLFEGAPEWSMEEMNFPKERWHRADVVDGVELYQTKHPVIQIKTHRGMRYYTHSERVPIYSLPYWGSGVELRKRML